MKFLIDSNLSTKWIDFLTQAGHEAAHSEKAGLRSASDHSIMESARKTGAIILTNDLDFGTILTASGARTPSVIQLRTGDLRPSSAIGAQVLELISAAQRELEAGALVSLSDHRMRIRVLPIA